MPQPRDAGGIPIAAPQTRIRLPSNMVGAGIGNEDIFIGSLPADAVTEEELDDALAGLGGGLPSGWTVGDGFLRMRAAVGQTESLVALMDENGVAVLAFRADLTNDYLNELVVTAQDGQGDPLVRLVNVEDDSTIEATSKNNNAKVEAKNGGTGAAGIYLFGDDASLGAQAGVGQATPLLELYDEHAHEVLRFEQGGDLYLKAPTDATSYLNAWSYDGEAAVSVLSGGHRATLAVDSVGGPYLLLSEVTEPHVGSANSGILYVEDNGSGKSQLVVKFASGAAQVLVVEP